MRYQPEKAAFHTLIYILIFAASTGSTTAVHARQAVESDATEYPANGEYVIGVADVVQISVWKNETLSRTVPVRSDGMISLPLVNDVRAAGRTPMQLREIVMRKLARFLPNAEVAVIVTEMHSFKVSVLGEVREAGRYEFTGPVTVLDALARAGGITEYASPSRLLVLRHEAGATKRIPFNYHEIIEAPGKYANFFVQPGDIIVVP